MHSGKLVLAIGMAVFFLSTGAWAADVAKIGVVDFQKIIDKSEPGQAAKSQINTRGKKMEEELKQKGSEIENLKKQLEREALVMSKEKREESEREFRIKVGDFKSLQKKYEQELQQIQKQLVNQIKKDVLDLVNEVGKKEGYQLIMEKVGVLYVPNTMDLTDRIIQEYNKKAPKPAGPDAVPKTDAPKIE
jgi:outer membrane protein